MSALTIPVHYFTEGQCNEARKKKKKNIDQKPRNKIVSTHRDMIVYVYNVNKLDAKSTYKH